MNIPKIRDVLAEAGLINGSHAVFVPLSGGVSSDICLVSDDQRQLVVKQALPRLRVAAEWFADPERNRYEQEYLRFAAGVDASAVPRILYSHDEPLFFAMEYIGSPLENWKTALLSGKIELKWALRAGQMLGKIHTASWDRVDLKRRFNTTEQFRQLRIEPYFLASAQRHPDVAGKIQEQVSLLERNRRCLVHGDFSPKNILAGSGRFVLLDCEVAWFGDPAFDAGFLLTHLFLKGLNRPQDLIGYLDSAALFWSSYAAELGASRAAKIQESLSWLTPMLLLARVDGKSPVEYLDPPKKEIARQFALKHLRNAPLGVDAFREAWHDEIRKRSS